MQLDSVNVPSIKSQNSQVTNCYMSRDEETSSRKKVSCRKRRMKFKKQGEKIVGNGGPTNCGFFLSGLSNRLAGDDDGENGNVELMRNTKLDCSQAASLDDPLIILGFDVSLLCRSTQYYVCAAGVFGFTLVYGYLQELICVHIGGRKYGLFLATCQFAGYSFWSFALLQLRNWRIKRIKTSIDCIEDCKEEKESLMLAQSHEFSDQTICQSKQVTVKEIARLTPSTSRKNICAVYLRKSHKPSILIFLFLSLIRSFDLGLTNIAMKFINYPAKTLIKSSRAAFTLMVGMMMGKRGYLRSEYLMVTMLITGLVVFLRADEKSEAIFHPYGVILLVISLCCDGAFTNSSELIMRQYHMSQDRFQLNIYFISFTVMLLATVANGELYSGIQHFFLLPGTISEIDEGQYGLYHHHREAPTWTGVKKFTVILIFTFTGLLGSSCAGALTKQFGALSTSIVSTNRKAATLFLSFVAPGFNNRCTFQHFIGMTIFLIGISVRNFPTIKLFDYKYNTSSLKGKKVSRTVCPQVDIQIV